MKRLLAYLFIVLGLGLTFNVKADASEMTGWCLEKDYKDLRGWWDTPPCGGIDNDYYYIIDQKTADKIFAIRHKIAKKLDKINRTDLFYDQVVPATKKIYNEYLSKTKIAKAEPSQTQDGKLYCVHAFVKSIERIKNFIGFEGVGPGLYFEIKTKNNTCNKYFTAVPKAKYLYLLGEYKKYVLNSDTQIAKKEPDTSSADKAKIEEEKRKIAEEKRKIEEEKRKIAEAKKKQEEEEKKRKEANAKLYIIGTGTGFFVNSSGYAASNEHVVGACREVATKIKGEIIKFKIIATDIPNDIGLIKTDFNNINYLNINPSGADIGEDIVAFGYPLSDDLSDSVKLTRGIVSSLSGPGNNYSLIQIDAAIQPGNSGGPVLNYNSQVVGIASAGLKKVKMLIEQEFIPENVNFAVAASSLSNFLKANNVIIGSEEIKVNNTKELAKIGIPATIQLYCLNTKAAHKKNKENKRYGDVMLEKVMDLK